MAFFQPADTVVDGEVPGIDAFVIGIDSLVAAGGIDEGLSIHCAEFVAYGAPSAEKVPATSFFTGAPMRKFTWIGWFTDCMYSMGRPSASDTTNRIRSVDKCGGSLSACSSKVVGLWTEIIRVLDAASIP